jgi:hypothetical protein
MLLVFTEDNVPTREIWRKAKKVAGRDDDLGAGLVPLVRKVLVRKVPATVGRLAVARRDHHGHDAPQSVDVGARKAAFGRSSLLGHAQ